VPVMLALRGTDISRRDALFLGWMGPRGLASLVFGLLAVIGLDDSARVNHCGTCCALRVR
jgi:NhaP-type Na+/H+ or K+/H+ antiporter